MGGTRPNQTGLGGKAELSTLDRQDQPDQTETARPHALRLAAKMDWLDNSPSIVRAMGNVEIKNDQARFHTGDLQVPGEADKEHAQVEWGGFYTSKTRSCLAFVGPCLALLVGFSSLRAEYPSCRDLCLSRLRCRGRGRG